MISVAEALRLLTSNRQIYDVQDIALTHALGRRCAKTVHARITMPPFGASAMDGYAVRLSDSVAGKTLKIVGEAPAGTPYNKSIHAGEAVRIFTGGRVPDGADNIIIQENAVRKGDWVTVTKGADTPRHIRRAGIDFAKGDTLIAKNARISPADIALAASGNHASLPVYRRPKVAIIANGDELRPPGSDLKHGQIISSNSAGLGALITQWGGEPMDMGIASDTLESLTVIITAASEADIIVPVGGASVGDYDFMKQAFEALSYKQLFSKIAVRPGKPTWLGKLGKQIILGLPGNPASAAVCAHLFLRPLITDGISPRPVKLEASITANGSRESYLRGKLSFVSSELIAKPFPRQDSSLITPLALSNTLIKLPANSGPWQAGDMIDVLPLGIGPAVL